MSSHRAQGHPHVPGQYPSTPPPGKRGEPSTDANQLVRQKTPPGATKTYEYAVPGFYKVHIEPPTDMSLGRYCAFCAVAVPMMGILLCATCAIGVYNALSRTVVQGAVTVQRAEEFIRAQPDAVAEYIR